MFNYSPTQIWTNLIKDSISTSSDSSDAYQQSSDSAPGNSITVADEETDTDDVQVIEKPPRKRVRGMYYNFFLEGKTAN